MKTRRNQTRQAHQERVSLIERALKPIHRIEVTDWKQVEGGYNALVMFNHTEVTFLAVDWDFLASIKYQWQSTQARKNMVNTMAKMVELVLEEGDFLHPTFLEFIRGE